MNWLMFKLYPIFHRQSGLLVDWINNLDFRMSRMYYKYQVEKRKK